MPTAVKAMSAIYLALTNERTAEELQRMLGGSTDVPVRRVESALKSREDCCVLVLDWTALDRMLQPLEHPEKVVLITRDEPELIKRAWESGISSVVFDRDPLSTVVLAILSACLRHSRP